MTKLGRVRTALAGLLVVLLGVVIITIDTSIGLWLATLVVAVSMVMTGIKLLVYYFTMGRYMVGGASSLVTGAVFLDFGIFTMTLMDNPNLFIVVYLLGLHAFLGVIDILRGMEAKRFQSGAWKRSVFNGIVNLGIALFALLSGLVFHNYGWLMIFYGFGLVINGFARIAGAFRKTAIVYIQ